MLRNSGARRFTASIVVIVVLVVPWWSFQAHSHWSRIRWIPFVSPPVVVRDVLANILLYVPFGYYACLRFTQHRWLIGVGGAALLSCATEFAQVFGHGRFPSVQDVLMNVLGAALGVILNWRSGARTKEASSP